MTTKTSLAMNTKTSLGVVIAVTIALTIVILPIQLQNAYTAINRVGGDVISRHNLPGHGAAPIATSGNNVYVVWSTNKTGNDEVMFSASSDGGKTIGDNVNLSNSTNTDSQDANIAASGNRVFVTWWERNATSNEPVLKISTDNGKTFGSLLKLASNGTIGSSG